MKAVAPNKILKNLFYNNVLQNLTIVAPTKNPQNKIKNTSKGYESGTHSPPLGGTVD